MNRIPINNVPFIRSLKETSGIYCFPWALQQAVPAFQGEGGVRPQFCKCVRWRGVLDIEVQKNLGQRVGGVGGVSRDGRGQRESCRGA